MYHDIISNKRLRVNLDFKDCYDILKVAIIKALTDLVNSKMSPLEKCSNLDTYGIPMTKEIERKVEQVSGFSTAIGKEEYAKGITQGTSKGKEEERSLLTKAFAELKAGRTADSLIAEGYDKKNGGNSTCVLPWIRN